MGISGTSLRKEEKREREERKEKRLRRQKKKESLREERRLWRKSPFLLLLQRGFLTPHFFRLLFLLLSCSLANWFFSPLPLTLPPSKAIILCLKVVRELSVGSMLVHSMWWNGVASSLLTHVLSCLLIHKKEVFCCTCHRELC